MKVNEIIDPTLNEDWKSWAAALGTAGVLGLGLQQSPDDADRTATGKIQQAVPITTSQPIQKKPAPKLKIDANKLIHVLPGPGQLLKKYAVQAGIKGEELVQLLAQAQHETLNFTRTEEVGSKSYFKRYDPKYNPRKAKILGNTKVGDGERYKGRGFLQITGRWNYRAAGKAIGLPLEQKPELLNRQDVAAKVSIWYWNTFVKPDVDNFKNVKDVTKEINPGLAGLTDRQEKFHNLMKVATK